MLAIETARSGQATGEATAVLRTLPAQRAAAPAAAHAPRRAPVLPCCCCSRVAAAASRCSLLADRTERGHGHAATSRRRPATAGVSLGAGRAHDYDPFGGDGEHPDQANVVVDGDHNTTWSTEGYQGGALTASPASGST